MNEKILLKILGFSAKENTAGVYHKIYKNSENYSIEVDFNNKLIDFGSQIISENKTSQNSSQPENWVVLECVNRLLEKGYKPKNIILEKTWASGHGTSGRLDICITRDDGSEYLLIECKTYGKEFEKAFSRMQKDGGQLFTYFKFSNKADIIMLYASEFRGEEVVYRNEIVKIEEDYRTGDVKDFYDKWNKLTKNNGVFDSWVKSYNFISRAITLDQLEDIKREHSGFIFNRFLEILRHHVVSDKPNAFNKIFTLFLCKVYDEKSKRENEELDFQWKEGVDNHVDFQIRLTELYKKGMKDFLEKEVTDFSTDDFNTKYKGLDEKVKKELLTDIIKLRLEKNNEFAIKEVFDHQSFLENAKVVKEIVELLQKFKIRYNKRQQYLSDFFELLLTTGLKQESGQFFTPVPIAQFIIKSIPLSRILNEKLEKGERNNLLPYIIDYAAGSGHFLTESMHEIQRFIDQKDPKQYIQDTGRQIEKWKIDHFDWATQYVYGIEKDYRLVKVGKVGCYLHGDGLANVILSDGLANFTETKEYKGLLKNSVKDFPQDNQQFDVVISNPPYSVSSFKITSREYYTGKDYELYDKITDNSSEVECLFIERTKQLLKDGGMAGIILPSSILSNTGIYTKAREIILKYFDITAITELGGNTFMATGTNTVTLFLRRKNNYHSINLRKSIQKFFNDLQDVTLNGIEKPVSKYVAHVWESISFEEYKTLLQKKPNEVVQKHEIYREYQKKIKAKNEEEKLNEILKMEEEKLFYFILAYPQKVVLVKSGEKTEEKQFLGYEFSNRRGYEGIHPIQRGKSIDECTSLFDPDVFDNPEKASTYIYKAFEGDFDFPINEKLKNNITRADLVDMLTFDRVDFEKTISLNVKKKVKIESKWEVVKLGDISKDIINGSTPSRNDYKFWNNNDINWMTIPDFPSDFLAVKNTSNFVSKFALENKKVRIVPKYSVLISCTATIGKVAVNSIELTTNQQINSIICKDNILPYYLGNILRTYQKSLEDLVRNSGVKHINLQMLRDVKIPLPPKEIQEKIVAEIETLEQKESDTNEKIEKLKNEIANIMEHIASSNKTRLENIALLLKRGKSAKYGNSEIQIIKSGQARGYKEFDFKQKYYVDDEFILDERKLEKGDVLINSTGVGTAGRVTLFNSEGTFVVDSHITILRPDQSKILPDFVLYCLANIGFKNIEAMAMGQSGQIELSITTVQNIEIPLPPLSEQQKIVVEINKIEDQIASLEKEIEDIPLQKEVILNKYLK